MNAGNRGVLEFGACRMLMWGTGAKIPSLLRPATYFYMLYTSVPGELLENQEIILVKKT